MGSCNRLEQFDIALWEAAGVGSCETPAARISQRVVPANSSTVLTPIYDQMSEKPSLLAVTFFSAACAPDPRTVANIRHPNSS